MTEKRLLGASFLILLSGIIAKFITGYSDKGTLIVLSAVGIMMWAIFAVIAFFPVDLRMSEKQRNKITDLDQAQKKYQKIMIFLTLLVSVLFVCIIGWIG